MNKLFIDGKKVDVEKIADKTLPQFKAQLKQAGLSVSDERAESIYKTLRHEQPVPAEVQARIDAAKAKAEEIAAKAKAAAEAKYQQK